MENKKQINSTEWVVIPCTVIDKRNRFKDLAATYKILYAHMQSF